MIEKVANVAHGVVDGLRESPLALAVVVVNVLFLATGVWALSQFVQVSRETRDQRTKMVSEILQGCIVKRD